MQSTLHPSRPLDAPLPERFWFCQTKDGGSQVAGESEITSLPNDVCPISSPTAQTLREALMETIRHERSLTRFWLSLVVSDRESPGRSVRVRGEHYMIGSEKTSVGSRGHAGRRFKIHFADGSVVETTNLWHQGTIPIEFRKLLADNAVFLPVE